MLFRAMVVFLVFFFKQKTAYEMRISDWSSDMCSSDLGTTPAPSAAQTVAASPNAVVQINTGRGRLVTLPAPMSDLFVADPGIADVQVRSPTQLYVFGKAPGESTVYATTKAGKVVYSSTVRVGNTIDAVQQMLSLALPAARRSEERSVGREC